MNCLKLLVVIGTPDFLNLKINVPHPLEGPLVLTLCLEIAYVRILRYTD